VWLAAIVITVVASAIQGTVGIGYGMVAVPILSLIDPTLAPVPQLLTVLPLTVAMAWRERIDVDLKGVGWLLAGRVPGSFLGVALLAVATQRTLDVLIGVVVIGAVLVIGSGVHVKRNTANQFGAGVASGATSMVASIGGPPTALLYTSAEAATLRSTLAAVFTVGVVFTVAVRAATGHVSSNDFEVAGVLLIPVLAGWWLSTRLKDRLPQRGVRFGVLALSSVAAAGLIVRAIYG
jgi:uncharacterized protein